MKPIVIKEIERSFKNVSELTQYVITQNKALLYATDRIRALEEKAKEKEVAKEVSSRITQVVRSIPEALCQIEIQRLMDKAALSPLDWEDTKKLDILIKNYYLSRKEDMQKDDKDDGLPKDIVLSDEFLTQVAANNGKR